MDINLYDGVILLLMIIMVSTGLWQLYSPGFRFSGIVCSIAAICFLGLNLYNNQMEALSIILFIGGITLVVLELFVVGAILGLLGTGCIITSFLLIGDNISKMGFFVTICIIIAIIEWVILVKVLKKSIPIFSKVVLYDSTSKESGYTSHDDRSYLLNQTATTLTELRPSGIIIHEGQRIDAVSDGAFIKREQQVRIIEVEGTRVVVKEI
ncbi:NfeD family protein [Macrococcus capreoli]|uniref:NfeD family protein n=1 Tax=Macrococcus capreoli TaxID=2982690 RepID=UPI0021D5F586|nr:NfeD family protein [Macrococcus sp. TMW 2.2395]MCU7556880.1 serine protease [Macrococcus sp. TMW 2.2395]